MGINISCPLPKIIVQMYNKMDLFVFMTDNRPLRKLQPEYTTEF